MGAKDTDVIPLPQWFKDEQEADEQREREAWWMNSFERYKASATDPHARERINEGIDAKIEETEKREDAPEGIVKTATNLLRVFKKEQSKDTPLYIFWMTVAALLYFLSPIDAIPDMIPGAGLTDDLFILTYAWEFVCEAAERHRRSGL